MGGWSEVKDGEEVMGKESKVKVVKKKVGGGLGKGELDMMFGEGM